MRRRSQAVEPGSEVADQVAELRDVAERLDVLQTEARSAGRGPWFWARQCREAADDLVRWGDDVVTPLRAKYVLRRATSLLPDGDDVG